MIGAKIRTVNFILEGVFELKGGHVFRGHVQWIGGACIFSGLEGACSVNWRGVQ